MPSYLVISYIYEKDIVALLDGIFLNRPNLPPLPAWLSLRDRATPNRRVARCATAPMLTKDCL